ncbi:kinase-like protein [Micromonospora sp. B006]|nr:kinase-like protein [Micromonospora sp. B006]
MAVLVGVTDYPRSDYPSVPAARENVRRLADEFARDEVWGLPRPMRLVELVDPDRATVLRVVADAGRLVDRQGILLIYFVGHAEPVGAELCLAVRDSDRTNPRATGVSVSDLVQAAGGSRADKRMVILDCCYSGRAAAHLPGVALRAGDSAGWYLLGAADGSSTASAPPSAETTLFTAALLRAMEGVPEGDDHLTPTQLWQAAAALLPPDNQPVHNDAAWAQQLSWLRNRQYIPRPRTPLVLVEAEETERGVPAPPALYAEPRYIGSHAFTGRKAQLASLADWAMPAQPNPVLLYEAIGGTGKSMLTWEWITNHAPGARTDWAGRMWYSFYDKGAMMADFCRRALAYMTGRPVESFEGVPQARLTELLLHQLGRKPWLLVLDGLERVLVAYHRSDASRLADETAGRTDEIATRDPRNAIRPLDDELLRQLAGAGPSKILVTSRLTPRVLVNAAGQPIPGVVVERLPGLRPPEAEALLRSCGIRGDAYRIQDFLQRHCDCHPLVIGVVAGLINDYLPDRGNFDRWAAAPEHGGRLDVGNLDLVQKRYHILRDALNALDVESRQLLWTLSLLVTSIDYATLEALDALRPHPATAGGASALRATVGDLERRGLVQYDRRAGRWDLHPVVRATARSTLRGADLVSVGDRIIDHFSRQAPGDPYENATTLDHLSDAITVVRTMIELGRLADANEMMRSGLAVAMTLRLEALHEVVALIRPIFRSDWSLTPAVTPDDVPYLLSVTARALFRLGMHAQAAALVRFRIALDLDSQALRALQIDVTNYGVAQSQLNRPALAHRAHGLANELVVLPPTDPGTALQARVNLLSFLGRLGRWPEAERLWALIETMDRDVSEEVVQPAMAELAYLRYVRYPQGLLRARELAAAEQIAAERRSRPVLRDLRRLRGEWLLSRGDPADAVAPLEEAVRMANEVNVPDFAAEALLALANLRAHSDRRAAARDVATRLSRHRDAPHLTLATIMHLLGETGPAVTHARAAYVSAWADGEPYVWRFELDQAAALLRELGIRPPALAPYDPARYPVEEWERRVEPLIAEHRRGTTGMT